MRKRTEYETHLARRIAKPLVAITLGGVLLLQPAAGLLPFSERRRMLRPLRRHR
ncbi:hypothetical protein [Paenibacillus cisolokensis]|uniref:hypothetical protein n=1 Tax=Paenibacillus cisolokensis TaxID=1658519 RepID=UPI001BCB13FD|nr:hypothetical protein [Paenibacillus cisolokensis]